MFDKHCPKIKITKKQQKYLLKPWFTKGILKSIKVKKESYKQFYNSTDPLKKNELQIKFKTYRNSIVKLTRQCKEDYFKSYFENNKNSKEIWSDIRNLINIKNSINSQQIALNIYNQTITDDFFIANQFNNFFTSIASKLVEKIQSLNKPRIYQYNRKSSKSYR